jgi:diacylglycerol kinase family enzyme
VEIETIAREAAAAGASAVVAAGGDGTVSAVAGVLAGSRVPLGVLPTGTLNHFARDLGIPADLDGAVRLIASGHAIPVDVGEVNGRTFINNCSLGLYPLLVNQREQHQRRGYRKWPAFARALLTALRRLPLFALHLETDRRDFTRKTPVAFIGNNVYQTEGLGIGSRASLSDGKLFVFVMRGRGRWELTRVALSAVAGRLGPKMYFDALCTRELRIETQRRRVPVALDGEFAVIESPLEFRSRPGALLVIAP